MKRRRSCRFAALWLLLSLLSPAVCAQSPGQGLEETLTDRLSSKEDVKWYHFVMEEPGDIELTVWGLQERWDGWTTHWTAAIYAPDGETLLASANARGYNGNEYSPPAKLSLLEADSGTYYIRISSASDLHFTTAPFRLELERTYRSQQPFVSSGDEVYIVGEEPFMGRLTAPEQIQRYAFEMEEPGDALIFITGMQEQWDGYAYHWRCTIYGEDLETVLARADVRGYAGNTGPAILSAPDLQAGTYYIQMASTSSSNPLMTSFTADPYRIQLRRYYHSISAVYAGDGVQLFQKEGDVLWAMDGTAFLKLHDGACCMALMQTKNQAIVPILISTEAAAVEYISTSTGEIVPASGPIHHQDSDTDYYYSSCEGIPSYTDRLMKSSSLPIPLLDAKSPSAGAQALADLKLKEELGDTAFWWLKNGEAVKIACGVAAAFVVLIVLGKIFGGGDGGGGGSDSDDVYMDYTGSVSEAVSEWWSDGV